MEDPTKELQSLKRFVLPPDFDFQEYLSLNPRQKKLFKLRLKLGEAKKRTRKEAVEEHKRQNETPQMRKRKEIEARKQEQKKAQEELLAAGKDPETESLLKCTVDRSALIHKKLKRRETPDFVPYSEQLHEQVHNKNLNTTLLVNKKQRTNKEECDADCSVEEQRNNAEKLTTYLNKFDERRSTYHRRRGYIDGADIDYVNERNRKYNSKVSRSFDRYTGDIKQNLERGTAL